MTKLCKADYQRLGKRGIRLQSNKNKEGQRMAEALFIIEKGFIPDENQRRDFQRQETKGHTYSISPFFEFTFGEANPARVVNNLEHQVKTSQTPATTTTTPIPGSQTSLSYDTPVSIKLIQQYIITGGPLTFHTQSSYEPLVFHPEIPLEIYKITLD
jgi:hypothetical protein